MNTDTSGVTLHHNLPGRGYDHFARMAAEVTAAQADLRPDTAPEEIDRVLSTALRTSRPVYLTIPADVAGIPVLAPMGRLPRAAGDADPAVVAAFTGRARRVLAVAGSASLLVGHLAARYRVTAQIRDLAVAGDIPVAVLPEAKGHFPESDPRFAGLYAGPDPYLSAKRARVAVEDADILITVGVTLADTVLGGAHQLPQGRRIDLAPDYPGTPGQACIDGTVYPGIGLRQSLAAASPRIGTTRSSHAKELALQLDGAAHAGDRAAADPDLAVTVAGDVHPAAAAHDGALAGHVRGGDPPGGQQPLPERGVQAARDRVLDRGDLRAERAHLERLRGAVRVGAGHADVHVHRARPDGQHRLGTGQQYCYPARAVVGPGDVHDVVPRDVQRPRHPFRHRVLDRPAAHQRRGRERQACLAPESLPDPDQPGLAFLHDDARAGRRVRLLPARRGTCPAWGARRTAAPRSA